MSYAKYCRKMLSIFLLEIILEGVLVKMEILKAENLKKYYDENTVPVKALDGVDITIDQGEFVAIVGTSGSGKSTLLNMLGGLDRPTSGSVTVDGKKIFDSDIVGFIDCTSTENGYSEQYCRGQVTWDKETASFQVAERLSAESYEVLDRGCKVLGNIFDNAELIEEW